MTPLAPAALASVSMMLTLNGEDYFPIGTGDSTFTFYPREYVTSVFPSRVLISGGTKIILRGGNYVFSQHLKCRFGGEKTTKATYFNTSAISCVVPPLRSHRVGDAVFVEVANNGIDFVDLSSPNKGTQLIYIAPPRVTKITPSRIVYGVPTTVYIKGSAFAFNAASASERKMWFKVSFSTDHSYVEGSSCTVISESHAECEVNVPRLERDGGAPSQAIFEVSMNSGVDFSKDGFKIRFQVQAAKISSIAPPQGPSSRKTLVSLVGVGLPVSSQAYCKFEEAGLYEREAGVSAVVYVPVLTANTGLVQCHAPPLVDFNLTTRSSSMLVSIEDISQNVSTNALLFEYIGDASILEIAPGRGSIDGGTEIRVTGYNFAFATSLSCHFGTAEVPATYISSYEVRCVSPSLIDSAASRLVQLSVRSLVQASTEGHVFLYTSMPSIHGLVSPSAGSFTGGDVFIVNGTGFVANQTRCVVQGIAGQLPMSSIYGEVLSSTMMRCRIPQSSLGVSKAEIMVSNMGTTTRAQPCSFIITAKRWCLMCNRAQDPL